MKRDWKPGDVAMLTDRYGHSEVGLCIRGGVVGGPVENMARWRVGSVGSEPVWSSVIDARPLVVIDPEDREQVERLCDLWDESVYCQEGVRPNPRKKFLRRGALQLALCEFAHPKPPKPDEPKAYLAVVKVADGKRFWRWAAGDMHTGFPWRLLGAVHADTQDDGSHRWDDLDVVKVLSEGVQS